MTASYNENANNALRARIFDILVGEKTPPNVYLSFVPGGLAQSKETLSFLTEPDKVDLAFDFATVANMVPPGAGDWVASGAVMWDMYKDWLDKYVPPPHSLNAEDQQKLLDAEADVEMQFETYMKYKQAYDTCASSWYGLKTMTTTERPPNYPLQLKIAANAMTNAEEAWGSLGKRMRYETAIATVHKYAGLDPVRTKERLQKKLGQPIDSSTGTFYETRLTPADLLSPEMKWSRFTFKTNDTSTEHKESNVQWGGTVSGGALLWSAKVDHSGNIEKSEYKTSTKDMEIAFDLLRSPIIRPWFSSFLLTGREWKWEQSSPDNPSGGNPLSNGKIPPEGSWGMIPTEAILVRNLSVKMDMSSEENKKSLKETQTQAQVGLGPIGIKGEIKTKNGNEAYTFKESESGIISEQPQILAFFCQLLPVEPNPNWALWSK